MNFAPHSPFPFRRRVGCFVAASAALRGRPFGLGVAGTVDFPAAMMSSPPTNASHVTPRARLFDDSGERRRPDAEPVIVDGSEGDARQIGKLSEAKLGLLPRRSQKPSGRVSRSHIKDGA